VTDHLSQRLGGRQSAEQDARRTIAGGLLGDAAAEDAKALEKEAMAALGIEFYDTEVPAYYFWDELQTWLKPTS
jgi:hypothetical protein